MRDRLIDGVKQWTNDDDDNRSFLSGFPLGGGSRFSRRATSRDERCFEAVIAARCGLASPRDNFTTFVYKHRAIVVRAGAKCESRLREARQCEARVRGIQANVGHAGCTTSSSHNGARVSGRIKRPN
jgi:hypothetical protein